MRYFHKTQNKFFCPTINVEKLWTLVSAEVRRRPASLLTLHTTLTLLHCYRSTVSGSACGDPWWPLGGCYSERGTGSRESGRLAVS